MSVVDSEIHILLGRELDPIEDVRHKLEQVYTEDYFNPINGDWISDDYRRVVDLATQPRELTPQEIENLDATIMRLNEKYPYIQRRLGNSSLLGAYVDVAEQVTALTAGLPVAAMWSASREALPIINSLIAEGEELNETGWRVLIGWPNLGIYQSSDQYFDHAAQKFHEADKLACRSYSISNRA